MIPEFMFGPAESEPSAKRRVTTILIAAYCALALIFTWYSRYRLSPDGFAYLQLARYYANGSLELAVNSWWGPLFSWLIVPFIWANIPPIVAARILSAFFGLGFGLGVAALVRRLTDGRGERLGLLFGLLGGAIMLPRYLTPDPMLSCLLTWYLAGVVQLLRSESPATAFAIGLLGGLCYLTKAYALPFVSAHLLLTAAVKLCLANGSRLAGCVKQFTAGLAGMLTLAVPWIVIISLHDGRPVFGTAGQYASAWTHPARSEWNQDTIFALQTARAGRLSTWENPMEIQAPWPTWSPFTSLKNFKKLGRLIMRNVLDLPNQLNAARWGLLCAGFGFALLYLFPINSTLNSSAGVARLWLCLSALLYIGGYMMTLVADRYLWPSWGMLLALCVAGPAVLEARSVTGNRNGREPTRPASLNWRVALHGLLLALIFAGLLYHLGSLLYMVARPGGRADQAAAHKQVGEHLRKHDSLAANEWMPGLHVAYWAQQRYLGAALGTTADQIADELAPFGAPVFIVFGDARLAGALAESSRFAVVGTGVKKIWAFQLRPK